MTSMTMPTPQAARTTRSTTRARWCVLRPAANLVVAGALLAACPTPPPGGRVVVSVAGADSAAVGRTADAVEAAIAGVGDAASATAAASTRCPRGAVIVAPASSPAAAARLADAVAAIPPVAGASAPAVAVLADVVAHFAVRGADAFVARAAVDAALAPALRALPGVVDVGVRGGRREAQIRIDIARLVQADVGLPDLLAAVASTATPAALVVRTTPTVRLTDVAELGVGATPELLRRDGAVDVVVRGAAARADVVAAAARVALPPGVTLAALDEDSDESVAVRVVAARVGDGGGNVDDLRRALLAVPGVRLALPPPGQRIVVDAARVRALSLDPAVVARAAAVIDGGLVVATGGGPVRVVVAGAPAAEAALATAVGRLPGGEAIRLFDVARASVGVPERHDRVAGREAERIVLRFDVGARRAALDEIARRIDEWQRRAGPAGGVARVERAADLALFDAVCP